VLFSVSFLGGRGGRGGRGGFHRGPNVFDESAFPKLGQ
jgi:hypothetical protein